MNPYPYAKTRRVRRRLGAVWLVVWPWARIRCLRDENQTLRAQMLAAEMANRDLIDSHDVLRRALWRANDRGAL